MATIPDSYNSIDQEKSNDREIGEPYERIGAWGWLGTYATGAILLFFLLAHLWIVHYASAEPITVKSTLLSLQSPFVKTVSLCLLLLSIVHGMVGLGRVILDFEILKRRGTHYLNWCLMTAGAIIFVTGVYIFTLLSSGIK